ncbi:hypothetical protein BLA60_37675 [Actinophytocola xinjiangensis]|uniref:DUF397 domain-containing protein n=1 Tax=Actinophytocola xinjiangensis TaxID=485602 RepID=A0A7Z0WGX8_9PSEU|nr:DUF397 domain-containing protein [Actinophytocola xinjiangensis]OLF05112.1 hypothetical protein BLA60_37675 [Actinophytocola xinjiangensis]
METRILGTGWRKSSLSGGENCVELACGAGWVMARDSKNEGRSLSLSPTAFAAFRSAAKVGKLDR